MTTKEREKEHVPSIDTTRHSTMMSSSNKVICSAESSTTNTGNNCTYVSHNNKDISCSIVPKQQEINNNDPYFMTSAPKSNTVDSSFYNVNNQGQIFPVAMYSAKTHGDISDNYSATQMMMNMANQNYYHVRSAETVTNRNQEEHISDPLPRSNTVEHTEDLSLVSSQQSSHYMRNTVSESDDVEPPNKRRKVSGLQFTSEKSSPGTEVSQADQCNYHQMSLSELTHHHPFTVPSNSLPQNYSFDSKHSKNFHRKSPQLLHLPNPYLQVPACHVTDQQRAYSPLGMTYLTPSRKSPVVTAFQTPTMQRPKKQNHPRLLSPTDSEKSCEDEDEIDVVNYSRITHVSGDTSKDSDISMVSVKSGKSTSPSGSSTGSPSSVSDVISPGENISRKKARTNYTPSQVQALEKVFHENPYPDSDKMEALSKELDIPENKIKVWFQNKRARWRRRVNDNSFVPPYMGHLSPVMSPMGSYGFIGHMMQQPMSPAQVVPGHFMQPGTPNSPPNTTQNQMTPNVTSSYQPRGHLPQYFPMYPYGMFSPYYCS